MSAFTKLDTKRRKRKVLLLWRVQRRLCCTTYNSMSFLLFDLHSCMTSSCWRTSLRPTSSLSSKDSIWDGVVFPYFQNILSWENKHTLNAARFNCRNYPLKGKDLQVYRQSVTATNYCGETTHTTCTARLKTRFGRICWSAKLCPGTQALKHTHTHRGSFRRLVLG